MTGPMLDATWRFQVSTSEEFDHLRNPSYYTVRHEPSLQREIVELKNVCWLRFAKKLGRHRPGRYTVRLRVYVGPETQWQDGAPCNLSVNKVDAGRAAIITITEQFSPSFWKQIAARTFQNASLKNGSVTNDGGNWHLVEMGPFELQNDSDLEFQFVDTVNPCWKRGMKWDYVELRLNNQASRPDPLVPMEATWRYPVAEAEEFDHRGNPAHIVVKRDAQLGRDVVELLNVYWLNFRKQLGTHGPGSYQAKLRFHVGTQTSWTFGAPCNVSVNKVERSHTGEITSRHPIVLVSVPSNVWSTIAGGRFSPSLIHQGRVVKDGNSWFILELERFRLSQTAELEFAFRDVENVGRKAGMMWDYVELKKSEESKPNLQDQLALYKSRSLRLRAANRF